MGGGDTVDYTDELAPAILVMQWHILRLTSFGEGAQRGQIFEWGRGPQTPLRTAPAIYYNLTTTSGKMNT